ncbi:MAG: cell division protein ZapB [Deltaproteobacteria bacterium]|nr:cell division protein ZapB [Deltaproteobacteria bacterium]
MEECFKRLEERVREIVQEYNRLKQENEVLADKLRLQDKSIDELKARLQTLDDRRNSVKAKVERLIRRIEGLGL